MGMKKQLSELTHLRLPVLWKKHDPSWIMLFLCTRKFFFINCNWLPDELYKLLAITVVPSDTSQASLALTQKTYCLLLNTFVLEQDNIGFRRESFSPVKQIFRQGSAVHLLRISHKLIVYVNPKDVSPCTYYLPD